MQKVLLGLCYLKINSIQFNKGINMMERTYKTTAVHRAASTAYQKKNEPKVNAFAREWYAENKVKISAQRKAIRDLIPKKERKLRGPVPFKARNPYKKKSDAMIEKQRLSGIVKANAKIKDLEIKAQLKLEKQRVKALAKKRYLISIRQKMIFNLNK
jgi:hypothetical protein